MQPDFFDFIRNNTVENFLKARNYVVSHADYYGYSDDVKIIDKLCAKQRFKEAADFMSPNTLLSPKAQMLKAFACREMGNLDGEKAQKIWAAQILNGIGLTGDGSSEMPYLITSISDEKEFLTFRNEEFVSQKLVQQNNRALDAVVTRSGKCIYFDVTDCMISAQKMLDGKKIEAANKAATRKWWKFW